MTAESLPFFNYWK